MADPSNPQLSIDAAIDGEQKSIEELKKMIYRVEKAKADTHDFVLERSIEQGYERFYFHNNGPGGFMVFTCFLLLSILIIAIIILVNLVSLSNKLNP